MASIAPEDSQRELDDDTRAAWALYTEQLRDLTGEHYERVESQSWTELQASLTRLQERREVLRTASS